jgi:hypothetical protein
MKLRPFFIISVLSVITSSPAIPAPAPVCATSTIPMPAHSCSSTRPRAPHHPIVITQGTDPSQRLEELCTDACDAALQDCISTWSATISGSVEHQCTTDYNNCYTRCFSGQPPFDPNR